MQIFREFSKVHTKHLKMLEIYYFISQDIKWLDGQPPIIILYYAIYAAHKYKKAKIYLKYDLIYKKGMNANIKAHSSARWATPHATYKWRSLVRDFVYTVKPVYMSS